MNTEVRKIIKEGIINSIKSGEYDEDVIRKFQNSPIFTQEYKELLLETWQEYLIDRMKLKF